MGGASAHFEVERGPGDLRTDLELELDARVHEAPAGLGHDVATEVTLGLRLKAAGVHGTVEVGGRELPAYDRRRLATTVRLRDGDSFFLAGVVPATEEMVLAITPRVIRAVVTADPPPAIWLQRAGEVDPAPRGDGR